MDYLPIFWPLVVIVGLLLWNIYAQWRKRNRPTLPCICDIRDFLFRTQPTTILKTATGVVLHWPETALVYEREVDDLPEHYEIVMISDVTVSSRPMIKLAFLGNELVDLDMYGALVTPFIPQMSASDSIAAHKLLELGREATRNFPAA